MTPNTPSMIAVGDKIAGKYLVERILGQGAMGMVVAAMHIDLQKRRAIKFMLPTALGDAAGVERFMREARACAELKSKHVATVYDVGRLDNGAPYIVMEYLEGSDLKDVLNQQRVLPVPLAVEYILQALEAIGEAHQANVVHRDLKPANMFLTTGVGGAACVKILDFGIAKLTPAGAGPEQNEMTTTAMIMGSPLYMSPEQMKSSRYVDARSDLWAVGVILYRMVTGALPFNAATQVELFAVVLKDEAPPPSRFNPMLPPGLEAIIMKCLEKDPAKRFKSAAALALALRPYLNPNPSAQEIEASTQVWRSPAPSIPDARLSDSGGTFRQSDSFRTAEPPPASTHLMASPNRIDGDTMHVMEGSGTALMNTGSNPAISARASQASLSGSYPPTSTPGYVSNAPPVRAPSPSGLGGQTGTAMSETVVHAPPVASGSRTLAIAMVVAGAFFFAGIIVMVFMSRNNGPAAVVAAAPSVMTAQPPSPSAMVAPTQPVAADVVPVATTAQATASAASTVQLSPPPVGTVGQTPTGPATNKTVSTSTAKTGLAGTAKPTGATPTATTTTKSSDWGRDREP